MELCLEKVSVQDKAVLRNLMELYLYDFSEYDNADVNEHGLYEYDFLDAYWTEESRHPFFVRVNGKLAGFALVRLMDIEGRPVYSMAEFFVMRKYRRRKVGQAFACQLFDQFPGAWHVAQEEGNQPSKAFWRKVIGEYTAGQYREIEIASWHGPVQEFESPGKT
jgi:predicted acetyltransferase